MTVHLLMYYVNIVDLLRENGVNVLCESSTYRDYDPNIVISYNEPLSKYLHVETADSQQWIQVDLQKVVYLSAYKIVTKDMCNWLSEWDFAISINGTSFKSIHHSNDYPYNQTFRFNKMVQGRYIKITGSAKKCNSKIFAI